MSDFDEATHLQHIANFEQRVTDLQAMIVDVDERCADYAAKIADEQTEQKDGWGARVSELERAASAARVKRARYTQDIERLTVQIGLRREHLAGLGS